MALFRWVLLLVGVGVIAGVFAYSRGWLSLARFTNPLKQRALAKRVAREEQLLAEEQQEETSDESPEPVEPSPPPLAEDSLVITVRLMPEVGTQFPAEDLILALRAAQLQHGQYGIFHRLDEQDGARIRYSVASLIEPGSFDLSKLKESSYKGVSIFMVLPAPEDGIGLFDDMLQTARDLAKETGGHLLDEQGGALSVQRERYMREEVIEFLRRHQQATERLAG